MEKDIRLEMSPMMTEEGKNELYLYSLRKMANKNAEDEKNSLTNMYGLKAFYYIANECMRNYKNFKYAVIRMDIYSFKTVNEFYGRAEGDRILKFISDCFRKYESENTIVGHFRADVFAMCVPFENKQELIDIATDIKKNIDNFSSKCKVFPSFGICMAKDNMDISLMSDYADLALSKIKGRVYTYYSFYDEEMRNKFLYERKIENEIEKALINEDLKVYVQPKVSMKTGKIIGGEALVRWIHPKYGFIYPDKFIPVLEKSGRIVNVDTFVWEKVFEKLHNMKESGLDIVPISINVSRVHVYQSDFIATLKKLIEKYDVSPEYIPLEITESVFTDEEIKFYKNVQMLQAEGFKFLMDDFGAGYSSLNMLKEEPVDEVKIDRLFLFDIENRKSQVVIRNVINMINELGLDMIAEGVETQEQAELLMSYGCDKAQGYLYYKPMPIDEFEKLLN